MSCCATCATAISTWWFGCRRPARHFEARHCWTEELVWVRGATIEARRRRAGAAGVLRRRMSVHAQHGRGAQLDRPRQRTGVHGIERRRHRRGGGVGHRRLGAAAQQRQPARCRDLGGCAAAEAAGDFLRHLCAGRRRGRGSRATGRHAGDGAAVAPSRRRRVAAHRTAKVTPEADIRFDASKFSSARSPSAAPSRSCGFPAPPSAST